MVQFLKRRQSLNWYKSLKQEEEEHAMFEVPEWQASSLILEGSGAANGSERNERTFRPLLTTSRSGLRSTGAKTGCPSPTRQGWVARCSFSPKGRLGSRKRRM
ncbi:putative 40S ribosomal protein S14 [Iris pallida]|uniref:40S ribosomal protein S14 n=1 Tax=Iris pallida TaxID=29817 RepID=A0AAX6F0P6_IRIPA|nr:putative 40S ribosomal protein S14 [Iris pallida]